VLVGKGLELAVGPGVEDPLLDVGPALLGLVASLVPRGRDLVDKRILVGLGALLGLDTLGAQPRLQVLDGPGVVGLDNVVIPILLNQRLEVLAVGRSGVGDVVVGQPGLELGFVPLVVGCGKGRSASHLARIRQ
jgi:hypothetical protein